jgi:hypothetical protein
VSEYHAVKTEYKDKASLIAALGEMGYTTVEDHETPQQLIDYHGRPTTYLDKSGDKANIIVRRQFVGSAANDLGFKKSEDGTYSAIVSQYDSGKHNTNWFNKLRGHYTEKVTIKTAEKQGFKFLGKKVVGNKVRLQWLDTRSK